MDPQFIRMLIRVVIFGGAIGIIGSLAIMFAMRAFRKGEFGATLIVAAVLVFVFVCCVVLLLMSASR